MLFNASFCPFPSICILPLVSFSLQILSLFPHAVYEEWNIFFQSRKLEQEPLSISALPLGRTSLVNIIYNVIEEILFYSLLLKSAMKIQI